MPIPAIVGAAIAAGGASIISGLIGSSSQSKTNSMNLQAQRETNMVNAMIANNNNILQQKNFNTLMDYNRGKDAFNEDFTKHQYEYTAQSMANAGINPAVLGSGGLMSSSVSSGSMSSSYTPSTATMESPHFGSIAPSIINAGSQLGSTILNAGVSKSINRDNNDTSERIAKMELDNQRTIEAMRIAANKDINSETLKAHAEEIKASADKMRSETRSNDYDYEYHSGRNSNKSDTGLVKDIKEGLNFFKENSKALEHLELNRQHDSFVKYSLSDKSDADFVKIVRKKFPSMSKLSYFEIISRRNQVRNSK